MPATITTKKDERKKVTYTISGYVDDGYEHREYQNYMADGLNYLCNAYYSKDVVSTAFFDNNGILILITKQEVDSFLHEICELFGMKVTKKTTETSTTNVETKIEEWP